MRILSFLRQCTRLHTIQIIATIEIFDSSNSIVLRITRQCACVSKLKGEHRCLHQLRLGVVVRSVLCSNERMTALQVMKHVSMNK
jgi:hypothetical protein